MTYTASVVRDVDTVEPASARPWLRRLCSIALFTLLTLAMTWPLGRVLGSRSIDHFDVFFNVWRLAWVHHALVTSPSNLFNANQFSPEPHVLYYGILLAILLTLAGAVQLVRVVPSQRLTTIAVFAAAAALVVSAAVLYSRPYRAAAGLVGVRSARRCL